MFILRDLLLSLKAPFSNTDLGRERAHWFVFTLLAVILKRAAASISTAQHHAGALTCRQMAHEKFLDVDACGQSRFGIGVSSGRQPSIQREMRGSNRGIFYGYRVMSLRSI